MLIALIMAIIFGTSRMGAESEFASNIPNVKKEIRKNVSDDARKEELITLLNAYEKTIKLSEKEKKKLKKEADKASADRTVNRNEFLRVYDNYYNSRERLLASLINYRILFQEQITEEEIQKMYADALLTSKKEIRQEVKKDGKAEQKLIKVFRDIEDILVKHIDESKTESVKGYLNDFETTIYEFLDEAVELNIQRQILTDNINVTRDELEALFTKIGQLRYRASREFATLREAILHNTDEKQWKAINKELKVFLKS